jgi:hypothetical protein
MESENNETYLRSSAVKKFQKTKQPYLTNILIIENERICWHFQQIPDGIDIKSEENNIRVL